MLKAAINRAHAYADAGADGLFIPGLVDTVMMARLAETSRLSLNIMVSEKTPRHDVLAHAGVARVSRGPTPYLTAMAALEEAARAATVSCTAR